MEREMIYIGNNPAKLAREADVLVLANTLKDCFDEPEYHFDEDAEDYVIDTLLNGGNLMDALAYGYEHTAYDLNIKDPDDVSRFLKGHVADLIESGKELLYKRSAEKTERDGDR